MYVKKNNKNTIMYVFFNKIIFRVRSITLLLVDLLVDVTGKAHFDHPHDTIKNHRLDSRVALDFSTKNV